MFSNANNNILNNPTIVDNSITLLNGLPERKGLEKLLAHSMPDAFQHAAARSPPPKCHPGTRRDTLEATTGWGTSASRHTKNILWMYGPFGVGKSAVAQSTAEVLESKNRLGAALFFSRPNNQTNTNRVFTSIAYQIATKYRPLGDLVDAEIQRDPSILGANLLLQFQKLLVVPLHDAYVNLAHLSGWVIILDGLNECEDRKSQREIIEIVTRSIREQTTPFRWFIISRPEHHITTCMKEVPASHLLELELPVSPENNPDIQLYLQAELGEIGRRSGLAGNWPPEDSICTIIERAAGMFIYAATVARFIGDPDSLGPQHQLDHILVLIQEPRSRPGSPNPFAPMDLLYYSVLERISPDVALTLRKILLLNRAYKDPVFDKVFELANVLALTEAQFNTACSFLQSVLYFENVPDHQSSGRVIKFYHVSFMEFMEDPHRSKELCILGCLAELQQEVIGRIDKIHGSSNDDQVSATVTFPHPSPPPKSDLLIYTSMVESLVQLCQLNGCVIDPSVAKALLNFNFSMIPCLLKGSPFPAIFIEHEKFRKNLPKQFCGKILRRSWNPLLYVQKPEYATLDRPFALGHGKNKLLCWRSKIYTPDIIQLAEGNQSYGRRVSV